MKIKIDFFSKNIVEAIGAGIYQVSVLKPNGKLGVLYIGESVFTLVRCATHLYGLKKNPAYFGFTADTIEDSQITLKFELLEKISDEAKRKAREKEIIKATDNIICQSQVSDRMKSIDEKVEALTNFLNS
ncbi:hypothetical protein JTE88_06685 [Arcanobacterium phocisimile]|uniref:GIY-YIG domain-containing protein n=1 Tax=Arcanobacterium phocisimile TaxID=1302235 RepID=A0ABX7IF59_9ACTO|nr:hypothetical protein [Arcanobacterium phocisimile]QRV01773.1 hypothetical protein JTE88_06685 [Arcanobacterium phocisimile]